MTARCSRAGWPAPVAWPRVIISRRQALAFLAHGLFPEVGSNSQLASLPRVGVHDRTRARAKTGIASRWPAPKDQSEYPCVLCATTMEADNLVEPRLAMNDHPHLIRKGKSRAVDEVADPAGPAAPPKTKLRSPNLLAKSVPISHLYDFKIPFYVRRKREEQRARQLMAAEQALSQRQRKGGGGRSDDNLSDCLRRHPVGAGLQLEEHNGIKIERQSLQCPSLPSDLSALLTLKALPCPFSSATTTTTSTAQPADSLGSSPTDEYASAYTEPTRKRPRQERNEEEAVRTVYSRREGRGDSNIERSRSPREGQDDEPTQRQDARKARERGTSSKVGNPTSSVSLSPTAMRRERELRYVHMCGRFAQVFATYVWPFKPLHPASCDDVTMRMVLDKGTFMAGEDEWNREGGEGSLHDNRVLAMSVFTALALGAQAYGASEAALALYEQARAHLEFLFDTCDIRVAEILIALLYLAFGFGDLERAAYYNVTALCIFNHLKAFDSDMYRRCMWSAHLLPNISYEERKRLLGQYRNNTGQLSCWKEEDENLSHSEAITISQAARHSRQPDSCSRVESDKQSHCKPEMSERALHYDSIPRPISALIMHPCHNVQPICPRSLAEVDVSEFNDWDHCSLEFSPPAPGLQSRRPLPENSHSPPIPQSQPTSSFSSCSGSSSPDSSDFGSTKPLSPTSQFSLNPTHFTAPEREIFHLRYANYQTTEENSRDFLHTMILLSVLDAKAARKPEGDPRRTKIFKAMISKAKAFEQRVKAIQRGVMPESYRQSILLIMISVRADCCWRMHDEIFTLVAIQDFLSLCRTVDMRLCASTVLPSVTAVIQIMQQLDQIQMLQELLQLMEGPACLFPTWRFICQDKQRAISHLISTAKPLSHYVFPNVECWRSVL